MTVFYFHFYINEFIKRLCKASGDASSLTILMSLGFPQC